MNNSESKKRLLALQKFQACRDHQTMESSWRKSACRISSSWKLHRTYRTQSILMHQKPSSVGCIFRSRHAV